MESESYVVVTFRSYVTELRQEVTLDFGQENKTMQMGTK